MNPENTKNSINENVNKLKKCKQKTNQKTQTPKPNQNQPPERNEEKTKQFSIIGMATNHHSLVRKKKKNLTLL